MLSLFKKIYKKDSVPMMYESIDIKDLMLFLTYKMLK